jgi:hypothetical protein
MRMRSAAPGRPDGDLVHLDDDREVRTWTQSLGVTREDLERAVAVVGPSTGAVYDFLARERLGGSPARGGLGR